MVIVTCKDKTRRENPWARAHPHPQDKCDVTSVDYKYVLGKQKTILHKLDFFLVWDNFFPS